jgi:hypothetical protein
MDLFNSDVQDISALNISDELKDGLNDGIQYIFSVVTKLQKNYPDAKYEIHGKLATTTRYEISVRDESRILIDPIKGQVVIKGRSYLSMYIYYNNVIDRPTIYIANIHAHGTLLTGNSVLDISKNFGEKINASQMWLTDASGLSSICSGYDFSMTYLYILSNGLSWYNSKGFVSPFFEEERNHNVKLLSLNIVDFLNAQFIYKLTHMTKKRNQTVEEFEEQKAKMPKQFYSNMESFFDFFKKYTIQYPFLVKTGLTLTKNMTVQEFFTRIKLFVFRNLPKKRTTVYQEVCYHLDWIFKVIELEFIEEDSDVIQLSLDNPKIILYCPSVTYNIDEPKIPSLLNIRIKTPSYISRRRTSSKTKRLSSKKSSSRRRTIG